VLRGSHVEDTANMFKEYICNKELPISWEEYSNNNPLKSALYTKHLGLYERCLIGVIGIITSL